MFTVTVEHEFCAAHAIVIGGAREPVHGHNWRVTAAVEGEVDGEGLLCDFHAVHGALREVCGAFDVGNLNERPPFDRVNPTAEAVAREIARGLASRLDPVLTPRARVAWVRVTEAAGCAATYHAPAGGGRQGLWGEGAGPRGR